MALLRQSASWSLYDCLSAAGAALDVSVSVRSTVTSVYLAIRPTCVLTNTSRTRLAFTRTLQ